MIEKPKCNSDTIRDRKSAILKILFEKYIINNKNIFNLHQNLKDTFFFSKRKSIKKTLKTIIYLFIFEGLGFMVIRDIV